MSKPDRVPDDSDAGPHAGTRRRAAPARGFGGARRPGPRAGGARARERIERVRVPQPRDPVAVIRRQSRLFTAVFVGTAVLLGLVIVLQTPAVRVDGAAAREGRPRADLHPGGRRPALDVSSRDKQTVINSEVAIMRAEPVIAGVVESVGMANLYPDLGEELAASADDPEAQRANDVLEAKAVAAAARSARRARAAGGGHAAGELPPPRREDRQGHRELADRPVHRGASRCVQRARGGPLPRRAGNATIARASRAAEGELREFELAHPVVRRGVAPGCAREAPRGAARPDRRDSTPSSPRSGSLRSATAARSPTHSASGSRSSSRPRR